MTKKQLALTILSVLAIMVIIFSVAYSQTTGAQIDPEQMRIVMFLPVLFQQCRIGENCAVVVPTPAQPCDEEWWMCE